MTYLVDTDRVIDYLKGQQDARSLIDGLLDAGLAVSIITYCEVYEGIYYGSDPEDNERKFLQFLRGARVIPVTPAIGRRFASLRGDLRRQGITLTMSDLLIAATAIQRRLIVVTRNRRHFEPVPGVRIHG